MKKYFLCLSLGLVLGLSPVSAQEVSTQTAIQEATYGDFINGILIGGSIGAGISGAAGAYMFFKNNDRLRNFFTHLRQGTTRVYYTPNEIEFLGVGVPPGGRAPPGPPVLPSRNLAPPHGSVLGPHLATRLFLRRLLLPGLGFGGFLAYTEPLQPGETVPTYSTPPEIVQ